MRIVKNFILFFLVSGLIFTSCSQSTHPDEKYESVLAGSFTKYDPPVVLTMNFKVMPEHIKTSGDPDDNAWTRWAKDKLGIIWEPKWLAINDIDDRQKIRLGMVSNDLPDVIRNLNVATLGQLVYAQQIQPVDTLIDEYGSPLMQFLFKEFDDHLDGQGYGPITYNGNVYGLPQVGGVFESVANTQWIRKDLVEALGYQLPETIEDFEQILASYKEHYPEGVGYGIHKSLYPDINRIMAGVNAYPDLWVRSDDDTLVYGSILPEVKTGLTILRDWYASGYLDPAFVVAEHNENIFKPFMNGDLLSFTGPWWRSFGMELITENDPKAVFVPMEFFKTINGESSIHYYKSPLSWISAVNIHTDLPDAIIKQLNASVDSIYRNDLDLRAKFDFIYPITELQNPINPDEIEQEGNHVSRWNYPESLIGPHFLNEYLAQSNHYYGLIYESRPNTLLNSFLELEISRLSQNDQERESYEKLKQDWGEMATHAFIDQVTMWTRQFNTGIIQPMPYQGPPTESMLLKQPYLEELELEAFSRIIMGLSPLDSFDQFVDEWYLGGGREITDEVNVWCQKQKQN